MGTIAEYADGRRDFRDADLRYANLSDADLRYADLRRADLSDANLSRADLSRANLSDANLSRANLSDADLRYADLSDANLRYANLSRANLRYADLRYADLRYADLRYADLSRANLSRANLRYADLRYADLSDADLRYADLSRANLSRANLRYANLSDANLQGSKNVPALAAAQTNICPEGTLRVYKKAREGIVVLEIPAAAARSSATSRKCRAEYAVVLETPNGEPATSHHDANFRYVVGETVRPDTWCMDRWQECAGGIHFFLTRIEAENY